MEDWLAKGLEPGLERGFEAHRRDCPNCDAYAIDMSRLAVLLQTTLPERAPAELWARIESRLRIPAAPAAGHRMWRAAFAACAGVLMVFGLTLLRPAPGPDLDRIQVAEISWGDPEDAPADPLSKLLMGNHDD